MSTLRELSALPWHGVPSGRRCAMSHMAAVAVGALASRHAALASAFQPFAAAALPGRLLVNGITQPADLYDLDTGMARQLPMSDASQRASRTDGDDWSARAGGALLRTAREVRRGGGIQVDVLDARSLRVLHSLRLPARLRGARLSHDARLLLAQFTDVQRDEDTPRLSVFDLSTGQVIKRGSALDTVGSVGTQFDWLPDGHYVYRKANQLLVSHPTRAQSTVVAQLPLPVDESASRRDIGSLCASPDGRQVAFTYLHSRGTVNDAHIWLCDLQGGHLRRLTGVANPRLPLALAHLDPCWSPDGRWVAGVLGMSNSNVQPVYPPDDTINPAWQVVGSSGCGFSPLFVLSAQAENVPLPWPSYDARYNLKVRTGTRQAAWLSSCSSEISWLA